MIWNLLTIKSRLAGRRTILTDDPENIKAILASNFHDYGKGETFHKQWKEFLGDSIFTTDEVEWKASRKLLRPQFRKERVTDLNILEKHIQLLITNIANGGIPGGIADDGIGQGGRLDVSAQFHRYTLDSMMEFLLGSSVNSLQVESQEFAIAFAEVQRTQGLIACAGPIQAIIPRRQFRKNLKVINDFCEPYVTKALEAESAEQNTFLFDLATLSRDRQMLRDQLLSVFLAGRNTTACTLSWTFYELARHPKIFAKLRKEITGKFGIRQLPTYQELKDMKYLQWVMDETLRLYPILPFNVRYAFKDATLPRGDGSDGLSPFTVMKGTPVGYFPLIVQRRQDLYPSEDLGMDAEAFNPDRWGNWRSKPWTYIPFNGGPRVCVGQQFALMNMAYVIVRVLQNFVRVESFMPEGPRAKPAMKVNILLQPGAVNLVFWQTKQRT